MLCSVRSVCPVQIEPDEPAARTLLALGGLDAVFAAYLADHRFLGIRPRVDGVAVVRLFQRVVNHNPERIIWALLKRLDYLRLPVAVALCLSLLLLFLFLRHRLDLLS